MSDIEQWEAMVLTTSGARERVADIEQELRDAASSDTTGSGLPDLEQPKDRINFEGA
jgi:hypothetical protein